MTPGNSSDSDCFVVASSAIIIYDHSMLRSCIHFQALICLTRLCSHHARWRGILNHCTMFYLHSDVLIRVFTFRSNWYGSLSSQKFPTGGRLITYFQKAKWSMGKLIFILVRINILLPRFFHQQVSRIVTTVFSLSCASLANRELSPNLNQRCLASITMVRSLYILSDPGTQCVPAI